MAHISVVFCFELWLWYSYLIISTVTICFFYDLHMKAD